LFGFDGSILEGRAEEACYYLFGESYRSARRGRRSRGKGRGEASFGSVELTFTFASSLSLGFRRLDSDVFGFSSESRTEQFIELGSSRVSKTLTLISSGFFFFGIDMEHRRVSFATYSKSSSCH